MLDTQAIAASVARAAVARQGGGVATVWTPFPDSPQERAYHSQADIIGFGGAGGGGKTDLLMGKGFTQFQRGYIFRRHYTDLVDLVERGDDILDGMATFVWGIKRSWELPSRMVRLGAIDNKKDLRKQKGRAKDFIGIDEADEFSEEEARYLMGWLRTDDPNQHTQVVLCFNPPGTPEGEWLIKFFAPWLDSEYPGQKAEYGELRWFIRTKDDQDLEVPSSKPVIMDGRSYTPKSRTFFLALVDDNPIYMATGYDKELESLFEPLRSQLRYGDFTATASDDIWQAIPTAWIVAAQNRTLKQSRPDVALRSVGVDPSRGGADEFAIAKLYGTWFELITHPGHSAPDGIIGAKYVTDALDNERAPIFLDAIAIGSSVYDHLKILDGIQVTPVNVSTPSNARDKTGRYAFANLRSQIIWQFREALDPNSGEDICLPVDTMLRNDLRSAKFSIVGGKIKIELKDEIKQRIGRSPDRGDAILLAWYGVKAGMPRSEIW